MAATLDDATESIVSSKEFQTIRVAPESVSMFRVLSIRARELSRSAHTLHSAIARVRQTWCPVLIRSSQPLRALHRAICKAYDRFNGHMFYFVLGQPAGNGWREVVLAGGIVAAHLAFLPAICRALENFAPPKRLIWASAALSVLLIPANRLRPMHRDGKLISWLTVSLAGWMILRTCLRPNPWTEWGVLMTWLLPLVMGMAARSSQIRLAGVPMRLAVAMAAASQAVIALLQSMAQDPIFGPTTSQFSSFQEKMIGTVGYQNQTAACLALCVGFLAFSSTRNTMSLAFLAVSLPIVSLTGCRGASAALVMASCVVFALRVRFSECRKSRYLGLLVPAGALTLVIVAILTPGMRNRLSALRELDSPKNFGPRIVMARTACQMLAERPMTGWGAGECAYQYLIRLGQVLPSRKTHALLVNLVFARETHNDHLQFVTEFGAVGLGLLLGLLLTVLRVLYRQRRYAPHSFFIAIFTLVYMLLHGLVSFPWQMAVAGPLAGLLIGASLNERDNLPSLPEPVGQSIKRYPLWMANSPWILVSLALTAFYVVEVLLTIWIPRLHTREEIIHANTTLAKSVPWSHRYRCSLGLVLARRRDVQPAIALLEAAEKGYRDPALFMYLGHCKGKMGLWEEALPFYQQLVNSGIQHREALDSLSVALERLGSFSAAADVTQRRIDLWNDRTVDYDLRYCDILLKAGRYSAARGCLASIEHRCRRSAQTLPVRYYELRARCAGGFDPH